MIAHDSLPPERSSGDQLLLIHLQVLLARKTKETYWPSDGNSAGMPSPPHGEIVIHRPTSWRVLGRLIIDLIYPTQAMGVPLLRSSGGRSPRHNLRSRPAFHLRFERGRRCLFQRMKFSRLLRSVFEAEQELLHTIPSLALIGSFPCASLSMTEPSILGNSLFLVGEIGGNDYNHPFFQNRRVEEIRTFVPSVVEAISSAITDLIKLGAKNLVVPGNLPIGCVPVYLTQFQTQKLEDYDAKTGCIKWLNEFSQYHNRLLQDEIERVRGLHPNATIAYADYYESAMRLFESPKQFGFKEPLSACCVGCDGPSAKLCSDPSSYASWDGLHLTEAAYRTIADGLLKGPLAVPSLNQTCRNVQQSSASTETLKLLCFSMSISSFAWLQKKSTLF
ncbi:unnamed protein product [Musa acuminata subsp. burmannicoides]